MHTKEPWEYREDIVYLGREGGFYLGEAPDPKDNARRIVACVNACAGIPIETLENAATSILVKSSLNGYLVMKQQRDELLAALKELRATMYNFKDDEAFEAADAKAKAAIKKADLTQ